MRKNEPNLSDDVDAGEDAVATSEAPENGAVQEDIDPDNQPLTRAEFRKILDEVSAENAAAEATGKAPIDDVYEDDPYDAYNPDRIADKAAAIAAEKTQRILTEQIQAQAAFRRAAMEECSKALSGFDIPVATISDAIEKIIATYPQREALSQLESSKQYMNLIHAEVGKLALSGKLTKREVKSPEDLTPTNSTRSSLGADNVAEFKRLFGKDPSPVIADSVRNIGSKK